jgi:hypothetical protein
MWQPRRHLIPVLLGIGLAGALAARACGGDNESTPVPQPSAAQLKEAGLEKLPLAPESERVDLTMPPLSDPTSVTNPLFPISDLQSAILSGRVDERPFHYAQADDGSVWYFGEDVFDYRNREVFTTEGTWLAGKDGPAQMIMRADPQVGQVHRAENIPAVAFEEVEIKETDQTVDGPSGPVDGAMVGHELHDDGTYSDKVFAPGSAIRTHQQFTRRPPRSTSPASSCGLARSSSTHRQTTSADSPATSRPWS